MSRQNINKVETTTSFFEQFTLAQTNTLLEVAQKLGLNNPNGLSSTDYAYFTRTNWLTYVLKDPIGWAREKQRLVFLQTISKEALTSAVSLPGIDSLSYLAVHFLLSYKHGREPVRERLLALNIDLPDSIYRGVHGVSRTPFHWPTPYYEKRVATKPMICPVCNFEATKAVQIQLHHPTDVDYGSKTNRNLTYYQSDGIKPMCANCHTLEHRNGLDSLNKCGAWRRRLPGNQAYKNPSDIFSANCPKTYHVQRNYYLKWHLQSPDDYKCAICGVSRWGEAQKVLTLELHHIDGEHQNSTIENLMLLCPNCHLAQ